MNGVRLIAVLMVLGGLIAYVGDRIGMKIGRKRLTLFGLRPRHTSIVVTIVTGILISGGSILALSLASSDVRTALFRLKEIQTALATATGQLNSLASTVAEQKRQLAEIEQLRSKALAERDRAARERDALRAEYEEVRQRLDGIEEYYQSRIAQLKELQETLDRRVKELQKAEADTNSKLQELWAEYQQLQTKMAYGQYIYQKDDIVTAGVVQGGRTQEQIREDLLQLLEQADRLAYQRGARLPGKEGQAVKYVDSGHFFATIEELAKQTQPWIVRVLAVANTQQGEPLVVYLLPIPNQLLFRQGEVIAQRNFAPGQGDPQTTVLDLLLDMNTQAVARGMLTREDGTVGEVPASQFVEAVAELRQVTHSAKVVAVAERDTWATGPLAVRLKVVQEG